MGRDSEVHTPITMEAKVPSISASRKFNNGDLALLYPYERLKVSSRDPIAGLDKKKREVRIPVLLIHLPYIYALPLKLLLEFIC